MSAAVPAASPPALIDALVRRIGLARYQLWFQQHARFELSEVGCTVLVPNAHFQDWLQTTFGDAVRDSVRDAAGEPLPVKFVIEETRNADKPEPTPGPQPTPPGNLFGGSEPKAKARPAKADPRSARRWHLLTDFVVGACNRVAHASAQSVVEEPGEGGNPLVLHGPVGTGKTHLLEGIFAGLRKHWPDLRVVFVTAEEFTNRFVQAMRTGKQHAFRKNFRECGTLLLDDLHFLATKRATQEEFLHTFDALLGDGRQVVVTCDCHPRLADEFLPELADRLLGGAVWGLTPPDADTRLAILRAKAAARGKPGESLVADEVLAFLAKNLRGNVRELEGALTSVRHYGRVTGRKIDLALAREALGDLLRHAVRVVTLADVDHAVCVVLRLPAGTLQSKQRAWAVSHPRMVATYLARKHTAASYGDISRHFGGKTHSTAVAAEKKVRQWLQAGERLAVGERQWPVREVVERVERELQR